MTNLKRISAILLALLLSGSILSCDGSVSSDDDDDSSSSILDEGFRLLEDSEPRDAHVFFEAILENNPDNAGAMLGIMIADSQIVVGKVGGYFEAINALIGKRALSPQAEIELDVKDIIFSDLDKIPPVLEEMLTMAGKLEKDHADFSIKLKSIPIDLNIPAVLPGQLSGPSSLDLAGEWDIAEVYAIGMIAAIGLTGLDLILAHKVIVNIPDFDLPAMSLIGNLFKENPELLAFDEGGEAIWKQAPGHIATIIRQLQGMIAAAEAELSSGDPQDDDLVPLIDANDNGKLDFADTIDLSKAMPFTINNELVKIILDIFVDADPDVARDEGLQFFAALNILFDSLITSFEGTADRRFSLAADLNPIITIWGFEPLVDMAEIDFAALWDDNGLVPLRDILIHFGCSNEVEICSGEALRWIQEDEPWDDLGDGEVPNPNAQALYADTSHFKKYSNTPGVIIIPRDNLYDVNNSRPEINYVDLPSPTYLSFIDPTFSGALFINMNNFVVKESMLIAKPYADCTYDGKCNLDCYYGIDYDCPNRNPAPGSDEIYDHRCYPGDVTAEGAHPFGEPDACGSYDVDLFLANNPDLGADYFFQPSKLSGAGQWAPATQYTVNTGLNWISLYFEHYVASVYNINFTEVIWAK